MVESGPPSGQLTAHVTIRPPPNWEDLDLRLQAVNASRPG